MGIVLLVDDDPGIRYSFGRALGEDYEVRAAATAEEGLAAVEADPEAVDLVLLDIRMPGRDGFWLLDRLREGFPNLPVVMVTAYGDTETAIEAMKRGAYDYLVKPFDVGHVRALIEAARKQRALTRSAVSLEPDAPSPGDRIIGNSPAMVEVYKRIGQIAATTLPCLITGETGTGKELVARALVQYGPRAEKPFLVVDCAAIPKDLLESELFGYEEGAFTGARKGGKLGKFELAHGGTLFLDEIAEIPLALQSKLLRVLQDGTFQRVGGTEEIRADVRVIAATCADLEARVAAGAFRADLFYRINVGRIHLPPLRERRGDIPALVRYFVQKHGAAVGRPVTGVSEDLLRALQARPWPGNVRELENEIRRLLASTRGEVLAAEIPPACPGEDAACAELRSLAARALEEGGEGAFHRFVARAEASLIAEALERTGGNVSAAARLLGITRLTLRKKAEEYGIRVPDPDA